MWATTPAKNRFGFVGARRFLRSVIRDGNAILGPNAPGMRFDEVPQVFVGKFFAAQEASDLIMAQVGNETSL